MRTDSNGPSFAASASLKDLDAILSDTRHEIETSIARSDAMHRELALHERERLRKKRSQQ